MTERAHGTVGGDDCQNRAARRYEKCSYLWHYFRRFEPFFPSRSLPIAGASRKSLSRAPFSSPPLSLPPHPRTESSSAFPYCLVPQNARRSYFLSSLAPSHLLPTRLPHSTSGRGPHHHERARTAGRFCPHRRGHHFNVTLIKSNNQYLPRKKF